MQKNLKIKTDISLLLESAFQLVQKGSAVLPALFSSLNELKLQIDQDILVFFDQIHQRLQMGEDFDESLSLNDFFSTNNLHAEKELIEKSFKNPWQIKQFWLDWMKGTAPYDFKLSPAFRFLQDFLLKKGSLWIVGEDPTHLNKVQQYLDLKSISSNCEILANADFETIHLRCKRKELHPKKGQIVLWIDYDSKGEKVISAIDEISGLIPGRAEFVFSRIFRLNIKWELTHTGNFPSSYEYLSLDSKF
jgi:hypothetical protein